MRVLFFVILVIISGILGFSTHALAAPAVNVATAPDARSLAIGTPGTIFVEFVNSGDETAINCRIAKPFGPPIDLAYQALDAGGALTGTADTPADVAAGAAQRFLVTFTATAAFEGRIHLNYRCDNSTPFVFEDVNDLFLTASAGDPPDLIAIFATPSGDGVMRIDTAGGAQAAGGAVVNIGSGGGSAMVDVTPTFGDFDEGLGVTLSICETNPVTAACLAPPTPAITMDVGSTAKTFTVIAVANAGLGAPLFPEYIRISVVFSDPAVAPDDPEGAGAAPPAAINGTIRGRASVAYTAPPGVVSATPDLSFFAGEYKLRMRDLVNDPNSDFISVGSLGINTDGKVVGIYHRFNVVDGNGNFVGEMDQVFTLEGTFDPAAKTFAGEMVFIPDVFLNNPPLRGNFVANFDFGRSVRGTYSFTSQGDKPEKNGTFSGLSRPKTLPTSSANIQATGMNWLAVQNCSIVRNIASDKVFDVYLRGVKVGTTTVTRKDQAGPEAFSFAGMITVAEGDFDISGELATAENPFETSPFLALDGVRDLKAGRLRIKDAAGTEILSDGFTMSANLGADGAWVTDCTANSLKVNFLDVGSNGSKSVTFEFRMPMP